MSKYSKVEKFLQAGGVSQPLYTQKYVDKKDKVINELLSRIANLEYELENKNNIISEIKEDMKIYFYNYSFQGYGEVVDDVLKMYNKIERSDK